MDARRLFVLGLLLLPLLPGRLLAEECAPLPLAEVLARVRAASPQLLAARARSAAAASGLRQARRLPNPSLQLQGENWTVNRSGISTTDPDIDFYALVSQPLEIGGKRSARTAAAAAEMEGARAVGRQTARELTLQAVRSYLAVLRARESMRWLSEQRGGLQNLVDAMRRRVEEGHAAEADLMKLQTEAAHLDTQIGQARLDLARDVAALGALLPESGAPDPACLREPGVLAPPAGDADELARIAVARHPETRSAHERLARARSLLRLEQARRVPDPNVTVGYKRTAGADTMVAGISVPLPLFDRNTDNVARAAAEERAAALDVEVLTRQLAAEAVALFVAARELVERAERADAELRRPAEVVRNAARSAFREGSADVLRLVDAERVYTEMRREALALQLEAYTRSFEAQLLVSEEDTP